MRASRVTAAQVQPPEPEPPSVPLLAPAMGIESVSWEIANHSPSSSNSPPTLLISLPRVRCLEDVA